MSIFLLKDTALELEINSLEKCIFDSFQTEQDFVLRLKMSLKKVGYFCKPKVMYSYVFHKLQEEELRASNDPKYQHLQEELHVEITAFAPPAEAHARIAYALTEVRKYLIPDSNDEIRQEQMREMEILAANGDNITAAAAAAAAAAAVTGAAATPDKRQSAAAGVNPASILAAPNLAMMHPAFRPANLAQITPQSIQSQAAAAAAMLRGIAPTVSVSSGAMPTGTPVMSCASAVAAAAAAAMQRSQQNGQLMTASPYIAAAPMIRKMTAVTPQSAAVQAAVAATGSTAAQVAAAANQQQKLYNEEMMLEAQAVSQAPSDVSRDEG